MKSSLGINFIFHTIALGGGMERYTLDLLQHLSSLHYTIRIIARKVNCKDLLELKNIEVIHLPDRTPLNRLNNYLFENLALSKINPDWPVISLSNVPSQTNIAITGGTHVGHLRKKRAAWKGIFNYLTIEHEKKFYKQANYVVAHSKAVALEVINDYKVNPHNVKCLYPTVNQNVFNLNARLNRAEKRLKLGVRPDQLMLLFPSNDHVRKGGLLILESIKHFNDQVVLVVAGKTPLHGKNVINLGYCPDMASLYACADASILASAYEPFGLVGPESILCGTPTLLAKTVGAAEVLRFPACISFDLNSESLKACIQQALDKFKVNDPGLSNPAQYIDYPYQLADHVQALINLLEEK
jgi:glycosyltransferase involved in cell wall biosynthesis